MASKKDNKIDYASLKRDLLSDLDQFLIDEDISGVSKIEEKQKALAELDKLIRQDLSYSQIISTIVKDSKNNIKKESAPEAVIVEEAKIAEPEQSEKTIFSSASKSPHLIDLRNVPKVEKKSSIDLDKYKKDWSKFKTKIAVSPKLKKTPKVRSTNFHLNIKLPQVAWGSAFSRSMLFALLAFMILLPIRGLVLVNQFQDDKAKLLGFGKEGFLNLQSGVISASEDSYQLAQADFEEALINFQEAQSVLNQYDKWMLEAVSYAPIVGKPIALSKDMLTVATDISQAAAVLNQKIQDKSRPTEYIFVINDQIRSAIPYLEKADKQLKNSSFALLPDNIRPYFEQLKAYLPATLENLRTLNEIFDTLLATLGHDSEKRYLVLFQNNNELRATGGFVGSIALVDVYQGKISNLEIPRGGTYDLAAGQKTLFKSPEALSLINPFFNIWDANWWYDFPLSAKKIIWFYQEGGGSSLDGVISINASLLQELLRVIGPVTLDEYQLTITADNVFSVLQEEVELNYDKESNQPKAVIADLVPIVLEKLLATDRYQDTVGILANSLSNKDIQIYLADADLQKQIESYGWSGAAEKTNKDYLAVINTNIAGGKTDLDISQTIDHQAEIGDNGEIINTLRITRTNNGISDNPFAGLDGANVSYLRVYVPLGAEFLEGVGFNKIPDNYFHNSGNAKFDSDVLKEENKKVIDSDSGVEIYDSLDKTVLAGWMTLKPGESKTIMLKYKLPFKLNFSDPLINDWWKKIIKKDLHLNNYSLLVQSQSGQRNNVFNSSVLLPKNTRVVFNNATDVSYMNITDSLVTYDQELNKDLYFGFILAN